MRILAITLFLVATSALAGAQVVDLSDVPRLSPEGVDGEPLIVVGRVLDADGRPVPRAEVYAWHADSEGRYHDDAYRGTVYTDADGRYRFWTIRPGHYGPPPHIHFRVNAGERAALTPTLHFHRSPVPQREVRARGREAVEYTFDIAWKGR